MAKIVIAGHSDCPYFARAELLGDKLAINLPDFKLHKIVKTHDEWENWLTSTCGEKGWSHKKSPLVWRELIDRGGKGVLIGGANEFQEYAKGYYGIESELVSDDMVQIAAENKAVKAQVDKEEADFKALSKPVHVCITNAASNICYGMLDPFGNGDVLGSNKEVILHLLDDPSKQEYLEGIQMEAEDLAHGLLRGIVIESDPKVAFKDCEVIVLLDNVPRDGKSRDEYIKHNSEVFINYAKIIDEVAKKSVKVLVAGNGPVNFNVCMMIKNAPSIPRQNFAAMARMVENQAKGVIAERLKVNSAGVVDLIIWGNPSGVHYIDVDKSRVHGYDGAITGPPTFSLPVPEMVYDRKWLETDFVELVNSKKSRAEEAMRHEATMSMAAAVCSTLNHWHNGSPSGQMFSLGVCSEGWYGVPNDLVFSYPVTFHPKGYWNVVQDFDLSEEVKAKILITIKDLESEMEVLFPKPKPPSPEVTQDSITTEGSSESEKKEGHSDCTYFARAELLGDKLAINLPDFKLHKIVKTHDEWENWLTSTCGEKGWSHKKSPLVWRELIDRGGKGVLIGGANEFQEYAKGYYGIESELVSDDMVQIAAENKAVKAQVDKEEADFKALSKPVHVCITNAASNICYGMLDPFGNGDVLGSNKEVILHLLDDPSKQEYLEGIQMEAEDLAHGLLRGIVIESDPKVAFKDCEVIVLLDNVPRDGKSRDEYIKHNSEVFINYAKIIDEVAKKSVKVLVAGNGPVNFNVCMMIKNAPSIPRQNFAAMARMVENQAKGVIAERLKVNSAGVVDLIIWGNPSGVHYIDVDKSRVHGYDGAITGPPTFSLPVPEMVYDRKWLETDFVELVNSKKSRAEEAMRHEATMSMAAAVCSTLNHWHNGSPSGQMFSLGVCSEGWYGVPNDLVFSYPVTFHPKGYWNVVQDFDLSEEVKAKILITIKDLESEMEVLFPKPKPPSPEVTQDSITTEGSSESEKKEGSIADGEQRLETIVEEKKETSEEEEGEKTGGDTSKTEGETDKEDTQKDGENKEEAEQKPEQIDEPTEEKKEEETEQKQEEQMPSA